MVESTIMLMRGKEKLSFGHALFGFVKSIRIHHMPMAMLTITMFDIHSGYFATLINHATKSQSPSSAIVTYFLALKVPPLLHYCHGI